MHELSKTIQAPNGKWINVHGTTGNRLESVEYDTVQEAVQAAKERSKSFDRGYSIPNPPVKKIP